MSLPTAASAASQGSLCGYCGREDFDELYPRVRDRLGHVDGEWAFRQCRACGSARLFPFPRPEQLASFYPEVYSFAVDLPRNNWLARLEYSLFFRPQYRAQVRRIVKHTSLKQGRVLDLGCGRGLRLLEFKAMGFEVLGADFQPEIVDYLKKHLKIPAVCVDAQDWVSGLEGQAFDLVVAYYVLEHVLDLESALAQCLDLLKPGGWAALVVPFIDSLQAAYLGARWVTATEAPRHVSIPSRAGMSEACRRLGFHDVQILPDSTLACSALIGLSAFPGAATTHLYSKGRIAPLFARAAAGALSLAATPWSWIENYVIRRPPLGIVLCRRPEET